MTEPWMVADLKKQAQVTEHSRDTHNRKPQAVPMRKVRQRRKRRNWNQVMRGMLK